MLVRLGDAGDATTWEDFYRRYRPLIFGFARRLSLTHEEAEEVCQDVFAEVSRKISEFDPERSRGSFRSWLFQRTEWRVRDKFRLRQRRLPAAEAPRDPETTEEPAAQIPMEADLEKLWETEWAQHRLNLALRQLANKVPARKFQAFELHAIREWSVHQVARSLGMNPATVCVNTHRLRKQLRLELDRLGD